MFQTKTAASSLIFTNSQSPSEQEIAQEWLFAVKKGEKGLRFQESLANLNPETLANELENDRCRIAFWVNVYNAAQLHLVQKEPERMKGSLARWRHFSKPAVCIAGQNLSLNQIEHGILRGNRPIIGMGYWKKKKCPPQLKKFVVDQLDPRVHFALNCSMASCPPIRFYTPEHLNDELELATQAYLEQEIEYHKDLDILEVSRLFQFYQGDFGGRKGIKRFLDKYGKKPRTRFQMRFRHFYMHSQPGNFAG